MDTAEMQSLLLGYLREMDWHNGVTKDDVLRLLAERDDTLLTLVNEYVAEGTYANSGAFMTVIPAQAWQASQGDTWRGGEVQYVEDVPSNFEAGPVGQDDREVYHEGGPAPETPGFGGSPGAMSSTAEDDTVVSGQPVDEPGSRHQAGDFGAPGSNSGEVDLAVSGSAESTGGPPRDAGGAGFGNAVGGGASGDVADTGDSTNTHG